MNLIVRKHSGEWIVSLPPPLHSRHFFRIYRSTIFCLASHAQLAPRRTPRR